MLRHLLFIPTYNCESQITRVLQSLTADTCSWFEQILIIDNQSIDNTLGVCRDQLQHHPLKSKIALVRNLENVGLGGTHKNAFDFAIAGQFDYVTILHGDDQGSISDFQKVFSELDGDSYYLGARFHPESVLINYSRIRTAGNVLFNLASSVITGRRILDLGGSGLNTFPVQCLTSLNYRSYSSDLTFHVYLILDAVRNGQSVRFIPISWREEDQISNAKVFRQGLKVMKILMDFHNRLSTAGHVSPLSTNYWELVAGNLPGKRA